LIKLKKSVTIVQIVLKPIPATKNTGGMIIGPVPRSTFMQVVIPAKGEIVFFIGFDENYVNCEVFSSENIFYVENYALDISKCADLFSLKMRQTINKLKFLFREFSLLK